jgi:hypothetical protein
VRSRDSTIATIPAFSLPLPYVVPKVPLRHVRRRGRLVETARADPGRRAGAGPHVSGGTGKSEESRERSLVKLGTSRATVASDDWRRPGIGDEAT